jgi:hypothetical protein
VGQTRREEEKGVKIERGVEGIGPDREVGNVLDDFENPREINDHQTIYSN